MNDDRAAEGIEHLQAAALEMIEAARAFLDVAEQLVSDRERISDAFATVSALAEAAARAGRSSARREPAPAPPGAAGEYWWMAPPDPAERVPRVQRIDVS